MVLIAALALFILLMMAFLGFIRFCEWILSRREIMS